MSESRHAPEALLRRLEWAVIRRLDGYLQGDYRTLFRGFGLDLADLREYQLHDDVRHMDWNVTARLQTPYVREYYEDREIAAWFLLDLSPSMECGSGDRSKRDVLTEITAVLARLLTRRGNRVGAVIFDGVADTVIPAGAGRRHLLRLMDAVLRRPTLPAAPATNLGALLKAASQIVKRRSLLFVISDFISAPGWGSPLAVLARRHEILAVRLFDPLEVELPRMGLFVVQDAETGEQVFVDTYDRRFRARFARLAELREAEMRASFQTAGVDVLEMSTGDEVVESIVRFADLRRRRSKSGSAGGMPTHAGGVQ